MEVTIKKWGNSASVRIPASLMQAAKLGLDQTVHVKEEAGRIIIEPVVSTDFDINELLQGISAKNLHEEIDFGRPVGKEVW